MEISRLTFTKETKEKMNKPLNHFQRGELRWKKLKECEDSGKLDLARNRLDIVEMVGGVRGYNAVYNWVSNLIVRGYVKETLTGFGKNGKMEYEYSTVKSPNFAPTKKAGKASAAKRKKAVEEPLTDKPLAVSNDSKTKMVIKYKDLSIELENVDRDIVDAVIERLTSVAG